MARIRKTPQQIELAGMEDLSKGESRFEKTADKLIQVEVNKRKRSYHRTKQYDVVIGCNLP